MAAQHLVAIGTSAGGIEALRLLVAALPPDFAAPICVVMHLSPDSPDVLDDILNRAGHLTVIRARSGARLRPGTIYVATPDYHLIVEPGKVQVTKSPLENLFRPAIDPLFRSAAQVYGPGAIGVVLTGNLGDGTAGLFTIKQLGGTTIVQNPADALFPAMPRHAVEHAHPDHVVALVEIAPLLTRLVSRPVQAA